MKKHKKTILIIMIIIILFFSGYSLGKSYQNIKLQANGKIAEPILVVENNPTIEMNGENEKEYYDFKVKNSTKDGKINETELEYYIEILTKDSKSGAIGWAAGWFNKEGYSYNVVDSFAFKYMPPSGLYRSDIGYLGTGGLIISKELFYKVGGFDLYYDPTCYEDTDLSLKVRYVGKELAYTTYLGVGHLAHQSTKAGSKEHEKLIKDKGDYFVTKWKKLNPSLLKYIK